MIQQKIEMVDLKSQYEKIKDRVDSAIAACIQEGSFINGPEVKKFSAGLANYLNVKYVIPCANGTDALQIAMMALDLQPGDEVIVPAFTYVATAEVLGLLKLTPVMVDADPDTFNIDIAALEAAITPKTKAIVPVHLFGQCANMEAIIPIAKKNNLFVIEDTAQAIGADYIFSDGRRTKAGAIGNIGCTSFFPSKNLGCYGDGGALYTNDDALGEKIQMIANHGQVKKYVHKYIGVNSRLDSIQAAVLNIKLSHLDEYANARLQAANYYDEALAGIPQLKTPIRDPKSTHVFHQYTLQIAEGHRDSLKKHLEQQGIPAMIYYPVPLNEQEAFQAIGKVSGSLAVTHKLCASVLSLPMHTELDKPQQEYIVEAIKNYFNSQN
ncbi:DegT/DnrJ/EryC1/StrS family aminotransferase [Chitinophaga sp. NPDC101104]|uniref:DegT/DnrJ/EryC1/StrS family aminotransferase n=1 Tax=Chitinophaga sp. NPDC101104 TaxID=3390561 RepID=UPI003D017A72